MSTLTAQIHTSATTERGLTFGPVASQNYLSWAQVADRARAVAGYLAKAGIAPRGTIAILADCAGDVAPLIQGIWMRRSAFTMLQQPTGRTDLGVWLHDTQKAIRLVGASCVVVSDTFSAATEPLRQAGLTVLSISEIRLAYDTQLPDHSILIPEDADVAIRQLTSGSTGTPKAVDITHGNLAANTAAMCRTLNVDTTDTSISWLPLSHDMGMVGLLICPMKVGMNAVVSTPQEYLRHPMMWAELIHRHRGSITCGPNFSYVVLARLLDRTPDGGVDLSTLRVAINGAEPICDSDLSRFVKAAARFGMPSTAPTAAYGMAEATLMISLGSANDDYSVDLVDAATLSERNRAEPATPSSNQDYGHTNTVATNKIVAVGTAVDGIDIRIVRHGKDCTTREVGSIEVRGTSIATTYTTEDGSLPLARPDGWFDTGDVGYFDEHGQLYICGRSKDVIIINGKNLYPTDVERAAAEVEGVRAGCVAAIRIDAPGEKEGFAILAETHHYSDQSLLPELRQKIATRVLRTVGFPPRAIELLRAGTLPKTPSGKLRRNDARALFAEISQSSQRLGHATDQTAVTAVG